LSVLLAVHAERIDASVVDDVADGGNAIRAFQTTFPEFAFQDAASAAVNICLIAVPQMVCAGWCKCHIGTAVCAVRWAWQAGEIRARRKHDAHPCPIASSSLVVPEAELARAVREGANVIGVHAQASLWRHGALVIRSAMKRRL
jgi:hypothetical protein